MAHLHSVVRVDEREFCDGVYRGHAMHGLDRVVEHDLEVCYARCIVWVYQCRSDEIVRIGFGIRLLSSMDLRELLRCQVVRSGDLSHA